jgi:hypothetical protein
MERPGPLESVILVRLLPSGDKGIKPAALQKDLAPLLEHRWSGNVLTSVLERSVLKLVARRQVCHLPTKSKKAVPPFRLTEEGRRATLTLLGVSELPDKPKPTWATLKKSLLLGTALGLARSSIALSKDDNLRAVLLTQLYALPLGGFPTLKQARDEWLRKALGMGEREKVTLETIHGALLRRELAETRPLAPKKALDRLLAKNLSARRDDTKELRDAILRGWIDRSMGEQVMEVSSRTSSPPVPAPAPAPLDLPAFARKVLEAARATTTGRYGHNKVFIIHVWRSLQEHRGVQGMDMSTFKQRLAEANNARLLDLSRADLVQAMDPEDVQLSEVSYLSATFHFIRVE